MLGIDEGNRVGALRVGMEVDVDLVQTDGGYAGHADEYITAEVADLDIIIRGAGRTKEQAGAVCGRVRIDNANGRKVGYRHSDDGAVGKSAVEILHFEAIKIISGPGMVVGKSVSILSGCDFGGDSTYRIKGTAVGAALNDELLCVDLIRGLPLEIDCITLRRGGELKEVEGQGFATAA